MAKFINKRNGRTAELLEVREKFRTVQVKFDDTGKTEDFSLSTWKRWWKPLEEESTTEEVPVQEEDVASDGTPYSQVMQEILADEKKAVEKKAKEQKPKAEKKPAKKRVENENVPVILKYIAEQAKDMNAYTRDAQPKLFNYRKGEGKVLFLVKQCTEKVEVYVKAKNIDVKLSSKLEAANGFYDRKLVVTALADKDKQLINSIIEAHREGK